MPIAEWCAKITQCAGGDPQQQVVASTSAPAGTRPSSSGGAQDATAVGHSSGEQEQEEDSSADDMMLTSGATIITRTSTNSDDGLLDSARSGFQVQAEGDDGSAVSTMTRRLSALVQRRPRVPTISATTLFNLLQTRGAVVVDCRDADEFSLRHLPGALNCPYAKGRKKTVDDAIELGKNKALTHKLATRDLMEIVVVGANRSNVLYKMDWGYRFARMLLTEGRVYSVRFLAQGFPLFARKYDFLLQTRPSICVGLPPVASSSSSQTNTINKGKPEPAATQYPNEIMEGFLYLGNFWQANSSNVVTALQITHVVNMGATTEGREKLEHVTYLDVDIVDKVDADIRRTFESTVAWIDEAAKDPGARVLIHCVQGVSRSCTIVVVYVMVSTRCTLSAAYAHVLKCRPLIFPNHGFMQQLIAYEVELYGCASVTIEEIERLQAGLLEPIDRVGSQLRESFV
ncbi:hypothetical protein Gpo141_00002811 [Globisporangium polare]